MPSKKFQKLIASFCAKPAYAGVNDEFAQWFIGTTIDIIKDWASKTSIDEVKEKAEAGNADAQYILGLMYYFEAKDDSSELKKFLRKVFIDLQPVTELKKDYVESLKWLRKAAEQGHNQAQFALGNMYCNGHGTARNYSEAFDWYKRAAENGVVYAEYNLGTMCRFGAGTEENSREALNWYERAAKHGSSEAQFAIGDMYYNGEGIIPQDKNEAFKWYLSSAESGYAPAQYTVGMMYREGNEVVSYDRSEAEKWLRKSSEQKYPPAQFELSFILGLSTDEAKKLYREAAESGYALAQISMGIDNSKNIDEAVKWFRKAAEQGDPEGQYWLGYYNERLHNYTEAVEWYRKSSEQGNSSAQYELGNLYENGTYDGSGLKQNYELAYTYYYLAYLCEDGWEKSGAQSSMQELEKKDGLFGVWGAAKISPSQVEKAKQNAQRMFDEIQRHKKQEKRRNVKFRSEIKRDHADVLQEMKEKEAKKQKRLLKENLKLGAIKALKKLIILGIVFVTILILAMITKK